jgi:hypothetical protein
MKYNIVLCGFSNDIETNRLINYFSTKDICVKVLIASDEENVVEASVKTYFHANFSDLTNEKNTASVSYEMFDFLYAKYPIILRAMSRWNESIANDDDKIFIIDSLFVFFNDMLKTNNIDAIVYGTGSPHHFYNLILTYAAKYNKIPNLYPTTNWITNRVRFTMDGYNLTVPILGIGSDSGRMEKYLKRIKQSNKVLSFDSKRIYKDRSTYIYLLFLMKVLVPRILGKIKFICNGGKDLYMNDALSKFVRIVRIIRRTIDAQIFNISYQKKYKKFMLKNANPNDSIIFYAQNQPEATSHPDGGIFPDLRYWYYVFLEMNKSIYYKEHKANLIYHQDLAITDLQHHRSYSYLNFFINKNVQLLPENFPTNRLLENNNIIFTLSGSVILESVVKGSEVYYCGFPFHGDLPGMEVVFKDGEVILKKSKPIDIDTAISFFNDQDRFSVPNFSGFSTRIREEVPLEEYANWISDIVKWSINNKINKN